MYGKVQGYINRSSKKDLIKHFKSGNKATIKKIEKILLELSEHPTTGTGNPKQLKFELTGLWSRRLNQKDRLIYEILEDIIIVDVISAMGHYQDK